MVCDGIGELLDLRSNSRLYSRQVFYSLTQIDMRAPPSTRRVGSLDVDRGEFPEVGPEPVTVSLKHQYLPLMHHQGASLLDRQRWRLGSNHRQGVLKS
jgi:hypothetical protein